MTTGPHDINYQIPDITLGDTFNEWRTITNDGIIDKLNRMKVYTGTSGDGISVGMKSDGDTVIEHSGHVIKGVTFSGPVTFNGAYTVVNAQEFSIDDHIIMLGATGTNSTGPDGGPGASDAVIEGVGGGGIQVLRSDGATVGVIWKPTKMGGTGADGLTGVWYIDGPHLGLTRDAWIVSDDQHLRFQTNKLGSAEGIVIGPDGVKNNLHNLSVQSTAGKQYELIEFGVRAGQAGVTEEGYINLINASTSRRVSQHGHGFSFGMAVRYDPDAVGWTFGLATTPQGAEGIGVVSQSYGNTFDITFNGEVVGDFRDATDNGLTLSPGNVYFMSDLTPGKISKSTPTISGYVNKPVLIALDPLDKSSGTGDRGLILNYRGALVPDDRDLNNIAEVQNRILVDQVNDFVVGDLIRFERDQHYGWSGEHGITGTSFYPHGVFLRGQANTKEEAEVVGMVTQTDVGADADKFYVTLNGKVSINSDRAEQIGITAGRVYFLSTNSAPDGRGGEGFSGESLTVNPPLTTGHIKKPWAVSLSPTQLIIVNYVGEVIGEGSGGGGGGGGGTVDQPPVGAIVAHAGTGENPPEAWLFCDGSKVEKSTYPELWGQVGHKYIDSTDEEATLNTNGVFRIPDIRDRMIVGEEITNPEASDVIAIPHASAGPITHAIALGEKNGEMVHTLTHQESGVKAHSHGDGTLATNQTGDHVHNFSYVQAYPATTAGLPGHGTSLWNFVSDPYGSNNSGDDAMSEKGDHTHTISGSVANNTASNAANSHNIMAPYIGLRWIIKAKPDPQAVQGGAGGCILDAGRNLLVNGNFDFWQRMHAAEAGGFTGSGQAGRSADKFTRNTNDKGGPWKAHDQTDSSYFLSRRFFADRWGLWNYEDWNNAATNGGVSRHKFNLSDENDILDPTTSKRATYYLRVTSNTVGVTAPSLEQRIENVDSVHNERATVSFWARRSAGTANTLSGVHLYLTAYASGTGDYSGGNQAENAGGAGTNYRVWGTLWSPNFSLHSTWKKYVYTFDVPTVAGVSLGVDGNRPVDNWPDGGSAGGCIPGQGWVGLGFNPVPSTYGAGGDTDDDRRWTGQFDIAQVQFEKGGSETQFDSSSHQDELIRCERYYQKSMGWDGCTGELDQDGNVRHLGFGYRSDWRVAGGGHPAHATPLTGSDTFRTSMRHAPRIKLFDADGQEGWMAFATEENLRAGFGWGSGKVRVIEGSVSKDAFGDITVDETAGTPPGQPANYASDSVRHSYYWIAEAEI